MKTASILMVMLALLQACKKSGNTDPVTIVGKWQEASYNAYEYGNGSQQQTTGRPVPDINPNDYILFNADGTGAISTYNGSGYNVTNFSYSISGSNLTLLESEIIKRDTLMVLTRDGLTIRDGVFAEEPGGNFEFVTDYNYRRLSN